MACVMVQSISLSNSKKIFSHRLRNQGTVILHRICLRKMSFQKYLKLSEMYKVRSISYYGSQESPVSLVTPQLCCPITGASNIDRIQFERIRQNAHHRPYLELPSRIRHSCRNRNIKSDSHISRPLRHIPEACSHF